MRKDAGILVVGIFLNILGYSVFMKGRQGEVVSFYNQNMADFGLTQISSNGTMIIGFLLFVCGAACCVGYFFGR